MKPAAVPSNFPKLPVMVTVLMVLTSRPWLWKRASGAKPQTILPSTQKLNAPEIRSGGCSILHVEAEVLDATGELGNSPGRISLDEIVGAEILIESAIFQHVVDSRED